MDVTSRIDQLGHSELQEKIMVWRHKRGGQKRKKKKGETEKKKKKKKEKRAKWDPGYSGSG